MARYCDRKGWPEDVCDLFIHVILGLDRGFIQWNLDEQKKQA